MQINVQLHGILRDKLPVAQKGKAEIDIQEGITISELLSQLKITRRIEIAVNEEIEVDETYILGDGDKVHLFTAIGGG